MGAAPQRLRRNNRVAAIAPQQSIAATIVLRLAVGALRLRRRPHLGAVTAYCGLLRRVAACCGLLQVVMFLGAVTASWPPAHLCEHMAGGNLERHLVGYAHAISRNKTQ